jgi:hypothetical protein
MHVYYLYSFLDNNAQCAGFDLGSLKFWQRARLHLDAVIWIPPPGRLYAFTIPRFNCNNVARL